MDNIKFYRTLKRGMKKNETKFISFSYEILPTNKQKEIIEDSFKAARLAYNDFIYTNINICNNEGKKYYIDNITYSEIFLRNYKLNPEIKFHEYKSICVTSMRQSIKDADKAFMKYFRKSKKNKDTPYPKYKYDTDNVQQYYFSVSHLLITDEYVKISKLNKVKTKYPIDIPENSFIDTGYIKKENNKYYAVFIIAIDPKNLGKINEDRYYTITIN